VWWKERFELSDLLPRDFRMKFPEVRRDKTRRFADDLERAFDRELNLSIFQVFLLRDAARELTN
jgi:hypothetical protein